MSALIFSLMLITIGFIQPPEKQTPRTNDDVRCGSYCLTVAASAIKNQELTLNEIETVLGEPGVKGFSLLQLDEAAKKLGLKTISVRTSIENLSFRRHSIGERFSCIASFGPEHFVLIYGSDGKIVRIADPPRKYNLDVPVFEKEWSGNCLLIGTESLVVEESVISRRRNQIILKRIVKSGAILLLIAVLCGSIFRIRNRVRKPLSTLMMTSAFFLVFSGCTERENESELIRSPEKQRIDQKIGGKIEISPSRLSLGVVPGGQGRTIPIFFEIRNSGQEILKIGRVTVSCGCTEAAIDQPVIQPGEIARLSAHVKIGESQDSRSSRIRIESSDTKCPVSEVEIDWVVDLPLKTVPTSLVHHDLSTEAKNEFEVVVNSKFVSLCEKCEIRTNVLSETMHLGWSPNVQVKRPGHAWNASATSETKLGILKVKLLPKDINLHHREEIQIELVCGDEIFARTLLPLNWTFRRWYNVAPSRIYFGALKSGIASTKSVVLRSLSGRKLQVRSIRVENAGLEIQSRIEGMSEEESRIYLTITAPSKKGPCTNEVIIETDSMEQSIIRLPVSCLVE